jgi:hypothetical protein
MRHLEKVGPHRLLATLTNDIGVIVDAMTTIPILFMHVAVVLSYLIYLGWLSWLVLLEIAGFIVLGVQLADAKGGTSGGEFTGATCNSCGVVTTCSGSAPPYVCEDLFNPHQSNAC